MCLVLSEIRNYQLSITPYESMVNTVPCELHAIKEEKRKGKKSTENRKDSEKRVRKKKKEKKHKAKEEKLGTSATHCHVGRLTSSL